MDLAVLFWFYKEPEVCENRLQLIKKHNPNLKIFGLFGGPIDQAGAYQDKLGKYFDNFYTFTAQSDEHWKWIHGDLMLLDWYDQSGRNLEWDSIAVVQWDMLVFDDLQKQFAGMQKGQVFFSGLRKLDKEIEDRWTWTKPSGEERSNYLAFLKYVEQNYGYKDRPPICCLFILEIFPREFFEKYLTVQDREVGMLEYKTPIYAKIFGIPFFEKDMGVRWDDELKPLSAIGRQIPQSYIADELAKQDGWRIFHPYFINWK